MKRLYAALFSIIFLFNTVLAFANTEKQITDTNTEISQNTESSESSLSEDLTSSSAIEEKKVFKSPDVSNIFPPPEIAKYIISPQSDESSQLMGSYYMYDCDIELTPYWDKDNNLAIDFTASNNIDEEVDYIIIASFFNNNGKFKAYSYVSDYLMPNEQNSMATYIFSGEHIPQGITSSATISIIRLYERPDPNADLSIIRDNFDCLSPICSPLFLNFDYDRNITYKKNSIETESESNTETTTENPYGNNDYVKKLKTNDNPNSYIEFEIVDNSDLLVSGAKTDSNSNYFAVYVLPHSEKLTNIELKHIFKKNDDNTFNKTYNIGDMADGLYNLYFLVGSGYNSSFLGYITDIQIAVTNGQIYFVRPYEVYSNNISKKGTAESEYSTEYWLSPDYRFISKNEEDNAEIMGLAQEITANCNSDYEKLLAIHDYIASNIYYDYDYIYGETETTYYMDIDVLHHKYSVCQGYCSLFISMARKLNIPTRVADGWSNAAYLNKTWEDRLSGNPASDHAWIEAYVDGRWVIIDATWDSPLKKGYSEPNKWEGDGDFLSHRYFDITEDMFSLDHKTEVYENNNH